MGTPALKHLTNGEWDPSHCAVPEPSEKPASGAGSCCVCGKWELDRPLLAWWLLLVLPQGSCLQPLKGYILGDARHQRPVSPVVAVAPFSAPLLTVACDHGLSQPAVLKVGSWWKSQPSPNLDDL